MRVILLAGCLFLCGCYASSEMTFKVDYEADGHVTLICTESLSGFARSRTQADIGDKLTALPKQVCVSPPPTWDFKANQSGDFPGKRELSFSFGFQCKSNGRSSPFKEQVKASAICNDILKGDGI